MITAEELQNLSKESQETLCDKELVILEDALKDEATKGHKIKTYTIGQMFEDIEIRDDFVAKVEEALKDSGCTIKASVSKLSLKITW